MLDTLVCNPVAAQIQLKHHAADLQVLDDLVHLLIANATSCKAQSTIDAVLAEGYPDG